jgi:glycosyltransferase involved in cell wall biosynthesis
VTLGLIARADSGGLGSQTQEIARHLHPDRILVVRTHTPRGDDRLSRFQGLGEVMVARNRPGRGVDAACLEWLCETDRVLTVEGCYNDTLPSIAREHGARVAVYANPELFPRHYGDLARRGVIDVLAPTSWETRRLGPHRVLRQPVALDRIPARTIRPGVAHRFLHVSAPAFHDRQGTELLKASLEWYAGPSIDLFVAGPHRPAKEYETNGIRVVPLSDVVEYWERWAEPYDCLVQPRRYGGLSLVAQEAGAAGVPILCLDRLPDRAWPGTFTVPALRGERHHMKGGAFRVLDADPHALARKIQWAAENDLSDLACAGLAHAHTGSWDALLPEWNETLA